MPGSPSFPALIGLRKALFCLVALPFLASAGLCTSALAEEPDVVIWKVWAGVTNNPTVYKVGVRKNLREGNVAGDITEVPCKRNRKFGVFYRVIFQDSAPVSYSATWLHPHLEHFHSATYTTWPRTELPHDDKTRVERQTWTLRKEELIDGDITLVLHREDKVFLKHVFQVRGCSDSD